MKYAVPSILSVLVLLGPQAALAEARAVPSTTIRHADLDLSDPRDAQVMLKRIHRAAASVCRASPMMDGNDIGAIERFDACYRQSVARAVTQLDAPRVTAAFTEKGPRRTLAKLP